MAPANSMEQRVLLYLIQCAIERRTTTYEELANHFDLPYNPPHLGTVVSGILTHVYSWCEERRLPHLTVLVVRKSGADVGLPGLGFWKAAGLDQTNRQERILLTEMYTSDAYTYFTVSGSFPLPLKDLPVGHQVDTMGIYKDQANSSTGYSLSSLNRKLAPLIEFDPVKLMAEVWGKLNDEYDNTQQVPEPAEIEERFAELIAMTGHGRNNFRVKIHSTGGLANTFTHVFEFRDGTVWKRLPNPTAKD